jgi:hypothetical protein
MIEETEENYENPCARWFTSKELKQPPPKCSSEVLSASVNFAT